MNPLSRYPLDELKLVYTLLHQALQAQPELMDSQLLQDLQAHLQTAAKQAGVDVTVHAQWASWLAGGPQLREIK
jgi:hypothetical protein